MDTVKLVLLILAAVCFLLEGVTYAVTWRGRNDSSRSLNLMVLGFFFLTVYYILGTGLIK